MVNNAIRCYEISINSRHHYSNLSVCRRYNVFKLSQRTTKRDTGCRFYVLFQGIAKGHTPVLNPSQPVIG